MPKYAIRGDILSDVVYSHQMAELNIETYRPSLLSDGSMQNLIEMVREPFVWYAPESTDEDIHDRLVGNGASYVDVVIEDEEARGFAVHYTREQGNHLVSYRGGTSILPSVRGRGVYKSLISHALLNEDYDFVATRTQNPRVYETLQRFSPSGLIYPYPSRVVPEHILDIAQATSEDGVIVEPSTLAVRGVHGFVRTDRSFMVARSEVIQRFFSDNLGRDDGYMVVVDLKGAADTLKQTV